MKSKIMFTKVLAFYISVVIIITCNSCGITTGFQDGRSLGKNNVELLTALTSSVPKSSTNTEDDIHGALPSIEMGIKYGLTDKLDASIRINTSFSFITGLKYQFLGDRSSKYALATGFDYSGFGFGFFSGQSFHFPLYTSIHPVEGLSLYFNPRVVHYRSKTDLEITPKIKFDDEINTTKLGWNMGAIYGTKNKFGLDVGYFHGNVTVGVCGLFLFVRDKK